MAASTLSSTYSLGALRHGEWFITIALLALAAVGTDSPFVFPSLSPTAYLLFISLLAENSSPRNTIYGHAIGLICGYMPHLSLQERQ